MYTQGKDVLTGKQPGLWPSYVKTIDHRFGALKKPQKKTYNYNYNHTQTDGHVGAWLVLIRRVIEQMSRRRERNGKILRRIIVSVTLQRCQSGHTNSDVAVVLGVDVNL